MASQSEDASSRLVRAAMELVTLRGVNGTTFVDVAKHAGVSRSSAQRLFPTRIDLFEAVIEHIGNTMTAMVKGQIEQTYGNDRTLTSIVDFTWERLNTPEYLAYQQIRLDLKEPFPGRERLTSRVREVTSIWTERAAALRSDSSAYNSELPRIILAALIGASSVRQTMGGPEHDPDFQKFRDQLKHLVNLAELSVPLDQANP